MGKYIDGKITQLTTATKYKLDLFITRKMTLYKDLVN